MGVSRRKVGYLLGGALSVVAAVATVWLVLALLQVQAVTCLMSLGCNEGEVSLRAPLLVLCGYLLAAAALAVVARLAFKSDPLAAFLWNLAPLAAVVALLFLWVEYNSYTDRAADIRRNLEAVRDAPAIHLGETFVKKADAPNGGVILFLHVPFTVDRTVRAQSLNILATVEPSARDIRYSPNPNCNGGYDVPTYGFHVVDRVYEEPPLPSYVSGMKIVAERLEPGRQYYLLTEKHITYSPCRVSDFEGFDPAQFKVKLSTFYAEQKLRVRPGE